MIKVIRFMAVLGAIWSAMVILAVCLFGLLMGMTDRFNGPHTVVFITLVLIEMALLLALAQAYLLHRKAGALLLLWFVIATALLSHSDPPAEWFNSFIFLLTILTPVTLTMLLSLIYAVFMGPHKVKGDQRDGDN